MGQHQKFQAILVILPTGNPPPHHTILVRASGTADEADRATEAGPDNLLDSGGLENKMGVEKESICEESQDNLEEKTLGTWNTMKDEWIVGADLPGYRIIEADCCLDGIYGDHVHANDGTHLDGGIKDDATWQRSWKRVVQTNPKNCLIPKG